MFRATKSIFFLSLLVLLNLATSCSPNTKAQAGLTGEHSGAATVDAASSDSSANGVDPLTKISSAELEKIKQFALAYYEYRVHQAAIHTEGLLRSGALKSFLAPTFDIPVESRFWWMSVVEDHFSVVDVRLHRNQDLGTVGLNEFYGDDYDVTIEDNQIGNVLNDTFVSNPKPRKTLISVVTTKGGYKINFDKDIGITSLPNKSGGADMAVSSLVVFQKDLSVFLENIKPWYKNIPKKFLVPLSKLKEGN